ncbi:MAG: PAS domain-containing protein [Verrucomicrobia bacterium]|nr:PAS domain-containing protein [Verrucomicrobiota bacterium]
MSKPLRPLIVEDSPEQAHLLVHELTVGGYEPAYERVDTAETMIAALERQTWDIILSDHYMPGFSSMDALSILQGKELDLPFIIVSGHISEEEAVAAMKAGAHDYVIKGKLARLVPAVERELKEAEERRQRKQSEVLYHSLVENLPQNVFCKDASGRFTFANQRFCLALGKPLSEIVGKTDFDLFPAELARKHEQDDARLLQTGQMFETVEEHQTPGRERVYVEVIKTPLRNARGKVIGLQGIYTDITERRRAEEAIRASLEEKIVLLKEVHHRVKNNLQIVISLLRLQAVRTKNPEALDTLQETGNRIHSMALLHEALYRSQSLAHVNFADYIESLCSHLFRSHAQKATRVKLERRLQSVSMDLDRAVLCGLIVNELISNALKHAFPEDRTGRIAVELGTTPQEQILLKVSDDGVGLPWGLNLRQTKTLGHQLVFMLTEKLRGTMEVARDHGTSFCITFQSKPPEEPPHNYVVPNGQAAET